MSYIKDGIKYKVPKIYVLGNTNLLFAEFFARTAYDSYDKSENTSIQELWRRMEADNYVSSQAKGMSHEDDVESELLSQLSHVYFHESTLEHICFNIFIKGVSRSLLQELARHRLASYTVKSTRYTMTEILHIFLVGFKFATSVEGEKEYFLNSVKSEMFVIDDDDYVRIEVESIFNKLMYQAEKLGYKEFRNLIVPKSLVENFESSETKEEAYSVLKIKAKRNIGDPFKHIVSENTSVDLGITINLRSLKNMFDLRLNGSAWFQFQVLMNEIYKSIPSNYMKLIDNGKLANIQQKVDECISSGKFE